MEAFERELARRLDLQQSLRRRQDALGNQDLAGLCFTAQASGEVGDRADRAVVPASLEADRADRRIALRDADAEVAARSRACAICRSAPRHARALPSAMRTARSPGLATGTGSLKKIIMPSPVKRSSVPSCSRISLPISA